jgi:hypothetical protein
MRLRGGGADRGSAAAAIAAAADEGGAVQEGGMGAVETRLAVALRAAGVGGEVIAALAGAGVVQFNNCLSSAPQKSHTGLLWLHPPHEGGIFFFCT